MKPLNVRFSTTQHLQISDLAEVIGTTQSDLARAALAIGMLHIKGLASRKLDSAEELVAIQAFRAKQ